MGLFHTAAELMPVYCRDELMKLSRENVEELRLRADRPPTVLCMGRERELSQRQIKQEDILRCLEKATNASVHTAAPYLKNGYLSYRGLRIGVCGSAIIQNGELSGFRSYSSLAIRIPAAHKGACDGVYKQIMSEGFENTLIIAPPGGGKTTALRELVRKLSDSGIRIGLIDERNEVAASDMGQARFDVGGHTDVLSGLEKQPAALMLLRGMNPQIIAMDEITKPEDAEAICHIHGCGTGLLATAHAAEPGGMMGREIYRRLLEKKIFKILVTVKADRGNRSYGVTKLYD